MNNKLLRFCLFFIASILSFSGKAFASSGELDVKELVLGHLGDAYEWHFFATENTEGVIPLPCIVRDENTHEFMKRTKKGMLTTKVSTSTRKRTARFTNVLQTVPPYVLWTFPSPRTFHRFSWQA